MNQAPAVSVILVSYYTGAALFEALEALFHYQQHATTLSLEIIVVDNGNPEAVSKCLADLAAQRQIIYATGHGNRGFAWGCNLGASLAKADHFLFLNPDCVVTFLALRRFLQVYFALTPKTQQQHIFSAWLENPDGSEQRGLRRNLLTPKSLLAELFATLLPLPFWQKYRVNQNKCPITFVHLDGQAVNWVQTAACSGACMLLSKALYNRLGGFDSHYFLHVEDLDFCYRAHQLGANCYLLNCAAFMHYQGTSTSSRQFLNQQKARSFHYYFATHFPQYYAGTCGLWLRAVIFLRYGKRQ